MARQAAGPALHEAFGQLHGEAVQAAVLPDQRTARHLHDLSVGDGLLHDDSRLRIGDYRVLYEVIDDQVLVTVVRVAHRRDVYEI